jgi:hypothetical protein
MKFLGIISVGSVVIDLLMIRFRICHQVQKNEVGLKLNETHQPLVYWFDLRKIFGPKREEDGPWRKLHNDELHNPYSSPNIVRVIKSRRMRWAGHVARTGRWEVFTGFWLGRLRRRWEDNIKLDLSEIGIDGANWIQLAQDRVQWWVLVSTVMNFRVP